MSKHWNLCCLTCNGAELRLWWNHCEDQARGLAKAIPHILTLDAARDAFDRAAGPRGPDLDLGFYIGSNNGQTTHVSEIAEWARGHEGHDIRAIDEYGQVDNTCGEPFACGGCGHSNYCVRERDHRGDHEGHK